MSGTLYIVATPIGNLKDITIRALSILKSVDFIIAEDTRVTKKLCVAYEIATPVVSVHEHTEPRRMREIVDRIMNGESAALVTDAGTPAIADPGVAFIVALRLRVPHAKIVPIPGATSVAVALSVSGLWSNQFTFLGFPPHQKKRDAFFREVDESDKTVVFFEATSRIAKTIEALSKMEPATREIVIGRELTKQFEHIYYTTPAEVLTAIPASELRGEFVIVVEGRK